MALNVVDVASHQTVQQAITAGADACIVKVSQGTGYVNPLCDQQYQLAKKNGLLLGVYHYAGGGNPAAEADYFLKHGAGYVGEAILILDWEEYQNAQYTNTNWARQFVNRVHEKTGVWCVLYGNRQDINYCMNLVNDCGLWFAGYPTNTQRDWNAPAFPYSITPWKNMLGWQYSAADVDRSKFYISRETWQAYAKGSKTNPIPTPVPVDTTGKNGIAIDNVSKDQATKMVQRIQTKYAWTLLRDAVKANKQKDKRFTLVIKTGKGNRLNQSLARLKQELKTYHPGYMQQNVVIVDGDKASTRIEARNMSVDFSGHMRSFLKDILLDGQTYAAKNSYGTYDVRVKGEGFNNTDAPIVLNEIKEMGKAKDVKIDPTHIKGFKY